MGAQPLNEQLSNKKKMALTQFITQKDEILRPLPPFFM